jgi:IclR family mhp operon transcriptional activator
LYRNRKISSSQYQVLRERAAKMADKELGLLLINAGYISQEDILASLRASESPFDRAANNAQLVEQLIAETRQQGYGTRVAGFTLRKAGEEKSDGFAVPVMSRNRIVGCINLIWLVAALDLPTAIARYLPEVQAAADMIGSEIDARLALNSAQATDLQ